VRKSQRLQARFKLPILLASVLLVMTACTSGGTLTTGVGDFCSTGICLLEVENNGNAPAEISGELCGVVDGKTYQSANGYVFQIINPGQKAYLGFSVFGVLDNTKFSRVFLGDCSDGTSTLNWDVRSAVMDSRSETPSSKPPVNSQKPQEIPSEPQMPECEPGVISIQPVYEGGMISYTLTNAGPECEWNVGPRVTFFTVSDSDSIVWASRDCDRTQDVDLFLSLPPGTTASTPSEYQGSFSSEMGCSLENNDPLPPGTYFLGVEVNGVSGDSKAEFSID